MLQRIYGLCLRYLFLYRRNLARLGDIFFWPVMDLLVWGFVTKYLQQLQAPDAVLFLLGGVIMWDLLYRSQLAISLAFTEEIWARNVANLFIAPISLFEYVAATALVGAVRAMIGFSVLSLLAVALYAFNMASLGVSLIPALVGLMWFGWSVGMCTMSLILRFGKAAEALVWGIPFLLQPLIAVFYPVSVLPSWLQVVSAAIPATHAFEAMRHTMATGEHAWERLAWCFGLNVVWMIGASLFLSWMLAQMRRRGFLGKLGME
jgi:ABC-2 type transport system permease protein